MPNIDVFAFSHRPNAGGMCGDENLNKVHWANPILREFRDLCIRYKDQRVVREMGTFAKTAQVRVEIPAGTITNVCFSGCASCSDSILRYLAVNRAAWNLLSGTNR